jgi:hypothetical protein
MLHTIGYERLDDRVALPLGDGMAPRRPRSPSSSLVPANRALPTAVASFLSLLKKFRVVHQPAGTTWESVKDLLSVHDTARDFLWPFYGLGDGGAVALWWERDEPCVVHVGSEGDFDVVARDFDEFLARIADGKSGISDMDEDLRSVPIAALLSQNRRPRPLGSAPSKRFRAWIASHSSLLKADSSKDAETLRRDVVDLAVRMLGDGRSKVYKASSPHWRMGFKILRTTVGKQAAWRLDYVDYGVWSAVPAAYNPAALAARVVALTKHPDRDHYEMSVHRDGMVTVDRDKELLLTPDAES